MLKISKTKKMKRYIIKYKREVIKYKVSHDIIFNIYTSFQSNICTID